MNTKSRPNNIDRIRRASPGDAAAIAKIHVRSWNETYTDLLSSEFMGNLMTVKDREIFWTRTLKKKNTKSATFIASNPDRQAIGFISCGPQRLDQFSAYEGEIYALYILRQSQGYGFGRSLMEQVALFFYDVEMKSASCVVLGKNQSACQFYEALGGNVIGELIDERRSGPLHEIAYGWEDLSLLEPVIQIRKK